MSKLISNTNARSAATKPILPAAKQPAAVFTGITTFANFIPEHGGIITPEQEAAERFAVEVDNYLAGNGPSINLLFGTPTLALKARGEARYRLRAAATRDQRVALTDGSDDRVADPAATTTLVASDFPVAPVLPGYAEAVASVNGSTGYSQVDIVAVGGQPVFGAFFEDPFAQKIQLGDIELFVSGLADKLQSNVATVSSFTTNDTDVSPTNTSSVQDLLVSRVQTGVTPAAAKLLISSRAIRLDARRNKLYASAHLILNPEIVAGFFSDIDSLSYIGKVTVGRHGKKVLAWLVPHGLTLDATIANATTNIFGATITTNPLLGGPKFEHRGFLAATVADAWTEARYQDKQ